MVGSECPDHIANILAAPRCWGTVQIRRQLRNTTTRWKQMETVDFCSSTWYFFLWIGVSSTACQSKASSPCLPRHSAARWPAWPQRKHLSCCPGSVTICTINAYKIYDWPIIDGEMMPTLGYELQTSLNMEKWTSCVAKDSIIKSASWPQTKYFHRISS